MNSVSLSVVYSLCSSVRYVLCVPVSDCVLRGSMHGCVLRSGLCVEVWYEFWEPKDVTHFVC